jgi:hypothetical protein
VPQATVRIVEFVARLVPVEALRRRLHEFEVRSTLLAVREVGSAEVGLKSGGGVQKVDSLCLTDHSPSSHSIVAERRCCPDSEYDGQHFPRTGLPLGGGQRGQVDDSNGEWRGGARSRPWNALSTGAGLKVRASEWHCRQMPTSNFRCAACHLLLDFHQHVGRASDLADCCCVRPNYLSFPLFDCYDRHPVTHRFTARCCA